MIERIGLVAGRELVAVIVTRSFVMVVLAPILSLVILPLFVAPVLFIGSFLDADPDEARRPVVELVDPQRVLGEELSEALGEDWEVVRVEPDAALDGLLDRDVAVRLAVEADAVADGSYRVLVPGEEGKAELGDLQDVLTVPQQALARARLVEAGLTEAAVDEAVAVRPRYEYVSRRSRDLRTIWEDGRGSILPMAVIFLMLVALSMAGQGLLTSTLEEKSTRVAEVLLGAVSPVELLTGKVLGQLGASLILAVLWSGPAWVAIGLLGTLLVGPVQALALLLLIGAASLSWAAVMGGVGSAMNDVTEAQHVLGPLYMVMLLGFIPAFAAAIDPDAPILVACSLLPPTAAPTMAVRLVSSAPPPWWQVPMGIVSAWLTALVLLWAAGRVFRIGLLLRGSPPNLRTLLRWIRSDAAS